MDTNTLRTFKRAPFFIALGMTALLAFGCTNTATNSGPGMNATPKSTPASPTSQPAADTAIPSTLETREPERYSVTTTITVQPTGSASQSSMAIKPLQFTFARMGEDRRISFSLPSPVGEVIYLEKAPLKYLIFPARKQFVELDSKELGFELGKAMSPAAAIERLKERTSYEKVGTESVNGRNAVKYRFKGARDTGTQAGTMAVDSIIFVDVDTGLPLRSEIDTTTSGGPGAHIVTATDGIQLAPDATLFEPPTGMKKVTSTELKEQVQGFVNYVRVFATYLKQQASTPPPAN